MATIIDGKQLAREVRAQVKARALELKQRTGIQPALAVVLVGNNPASEVYVANKEKACGWVGVRSLTIRMPESATEAEVLAQIEALNADDTVHGILVQLPLPAHIDSEKLLKRISPDKDVDGFHPQNAGELMRARALLEPCTPTGVIMLIKRAGVTMEGAHAVVIGRSNVVGKPVAMMLLRENCTVTVCHSRTRNLADVLRTADIVVSAIGVAGLIKGDMLKAGATVIDVGITRQKDGTLAGDVDFESAEKIAGAITPVPGGVGPMTIALLLDNTVKAALAKYA